MPVQGHLYLELRQGRSYLPSSSEATGASLGHRHSPALP